MRVEFNEWVPLPVAVPYGYLRTPRDWARLYGAFGDVEDRGEGWFAVPLRGFPFPLVTRIVADDPQRRVRWRFRGFWRGEGEVRLAAERGGTRISGFEEIRPAGLLLLAPLAERILEPRFRAIWASGFRRLRAEGRQGSHADAHA